MDILQLKKIIIEIPIVHLLGLITACSLLALFGKVKYSLICLYGAVIYWVFFLNESKFGFSENAGIFHTLLFIFSSVAFIGISAWLIFVEK